MSKDDYDDLPQQSSNTEINGWFSPREDKALPQIVKGTLIDVKERKNPKRNQAKEYLLIELAEPVEGLIMNGEDSEEGMLSTNDVIGIDMRQALEVLRDHRGKVKLVFVGKEQVEDREWWRINVFADMPKKAKHTERHYDSKGNERRDVAPKDISKGDDDIPF